MTSKALICCDKYDCQKFFMDFGLLYGVTLLILGGVNVYMRNFSSKDCHLCGDLNYTTQAVGIFFIVCGTIISIICMKYRAFVSYIGVNVMLTFLIPEFVATLASMILFFKHNSVSGTEPCIPIFHAFTESAGCHSVQLRFVYGSMVFKMMPLCILGVTLVGTSLYDILGSWCSSVAEDMPRIVSTTETTPLLKSINTV